MQNIFLHHKNLIKESFFPLWCTDGLKDAAGETHDIMGCSLVSTASQHMDFSVGVSLVFAERHQRTVPVGPRV